jgi:Protein of unknown function (DUF4197)
MTISRVSVTLKIAAILMAGAAISQPVAVWAKLPAVTSPLKSVLGKASDSALDKLAVPGAFQADDAIRIVLPGLGGGTASSLLNIGDKLGVTNGLTKGINDAAGLAAKEAKPIFRSAIDNFKITDAPGLITKSDGGTQYLKSSSSTVLREKLKPLIVAALGKVGAFGMLEKLGSARSLLGSAGLTQDGLSNSVTDQALNGIFKYMGKEEANLRKSPLTIGKKLLDAKLGQ